MQKKDDLKRILPDMPPLVREFAKYKAIIENCSHLTVTEYVLDLRTFFRYLTALKYSLPTDGE